MRKPRRGFLGQLNQKRFSQRENLHKNAASGRRFCGFRFIISVNFPCILGNLFLVRAPVFPIFYRQEISRPADAPKLPENGIVSPAGGILGSRRTEPDKGAILC